MTSNQATASLQILTDQALARMLLAVIAQDTAVLAPAQAALGISMQEVNFLVIAEAANRWLSAQSRA
jgi:hypothetical protein